MKLVNLLSAVGLLTLTPMANASLLKEWDCARELHKLNGQPVDHENSVIITKGSDSYIIGPSGVYLARGLQKSEWGKKVNLVLKDRSPEQVLYVDITKNGNAIIKKDSNDSTLPKFATSTLQNPESKLIEVLRPEVIAVGTKGDQATKFALKNNCAIPGMNMPNEWAKSPTPVKFPGNDYLKGKPSNGQDDDEDNADR